MNALLDASALTDIAERLVGAARRAGATPEELMEAVWVAAEMRAGGAYAHAALMLSTLGEESRGQRETKQPRASTPGSADSGVRCASTGNGRTRWDWQVERP